MSLQIFSFSHCSVSFSALLALLFGFYLRSSFMAVRNVSEPIFFVAKVFSASQVKPFRWHSTSLPAAFNLYDPIFPVLLQRLPRLWRISQIMEFRAFLNCCIEKGCFIACIMGFCLSALLGAFSGVLANVFFTVIIPEFVFFFINQPVDFL